MKAENVSVIWALDWGLSKEGTAEAVELICIRSALDPELEV